MSEGVYVMFNAAGQRVELRVEGVCTRGVHASGYCEVCWWEMLRRCILGAPVAAEDLAMYPPPYLAGEGA